MLVSYFLFIWGKISDSDVPRHCKQSGKKFIVWYYFSATFNFMSFITSVLSILIRHGLVPWLWIHFIADRRSPSIPSFRGQVYTRKTKLFQISPNPFNHFDYHIFNITAYCSIEKLNSFHPPKNSKCNHHNLRPDRFSSTIPLPHHQPLFCHPICIKMKKNVMIRLCIRFIPFIANLFTFCAFNLCVSGGWGRAKKKQTLAPKRSVWNGIKCKPRAALVLLCLCENILPPLSTLCVINHARCSDSFSFGINPKNYTGWFWLATLNWPFLSSSSPSSVYNSCRAIDKNAN